MAVQSVDPNIFLGADQRTRAANPFKGVAERLQKLELGEESLKTSRKARQDQAEAEAFLKLQPLIASNPEAALAQLSQSTVFDDADRDALATAISVGDQGTIDTFTQISNKRLGIPPTKGVVLGLDEQLTDPITGEVIAAGPTAGVPEIPLTLLQGLSPDLQEKGAAAFKAAGGGKDGMKAFTSIIDKGSEQERRLASPALLNASFPRASTAEMAQLQAAMGAAKTTEAGLKAAGIVRKEQARTKKAQGFQNRAIALLTRIVGDPDGPGEDLNIFEDFIGGFAEKRDLRQPHPELGDVLGGAEGRVDFRFQDQENELIADIDEAANILTADNLDLMTGVLSESDIKILKDLAGGALRRTRGKKKFIKDAREVLAKLKSKRVLTIDDTTPRIPVFNPQTGEFE